MLQTQISKPIFRRTLIQVLFYKTCFKMPYTIKMPIMTITLFNKSSSLINSSIIMVTITLIFKNTKTQAIFKIITTNYNLLNHCLNLRRTFMRVISPNHFIQIKVLMIFRINNRITIKINNQCTIISNNNSTQECRTTSIQIITQTILSSLKDLILTSLTSLIQCYNNQVLMATDNGRKS